MTNEQLLKFLANPPADKNAPCNEAIEWIGTRDLATAWRECPRGDWMLWLMQYGECDIRLLTACKAAASDVARPLIADPRSIAALDAAHAFGRGEISEEELAAAAADAAAAYAASYAADAAASYAASYAAASAMACTDAAADASYAAADASYAAAAAAAAADAASAAKKAAHAETAENIRAVIPDITPLLGG